MKKNSKVLSTIMFISIVLLVLILITIIAFDVWFVAETVEVGSGMVILIWLFLFSAEVPIVVGMIALIIVLSIKLYRDMKGVE